MIATTLSHAFRYPALHRAQWHSRKALEALQWCRFKDLLQVAYDQSPFYRQRFDDVGLVPDAIRDRNDLERIPITTREDLRNPDHLICCGHRIEDLHRSLTTGSTGRRTCSYFDDRAWILAKYLLKMRARLTTGVSSTDRIALLQESDTAANSSRWRERLFRVRSFSIDEPVSSLLEALQAFDPTVLYGFPSHLVRLASEACDDFQISRIYTSGELLMAEDSRVLEAAFEAPVLDVYGCTEVKEIAWQCLEQGGYHINSDWLLVEIPTDDPLSDPDGPILVTALYNHAMPIIRYQVGDTGTLLPEPCPCGRGLPLMRPTGGRTVDYFQLPDGSSVSPYAMSFAMEQVQGLLQYQIIQETIDRVMVRAVIRPERQEAIKREIESKLGEVLSGVAIEIQTLESIEPDSTGKFRIVYSRLAAPE